MSMAYVCDSRVQGSIHDASAYTSTPLLSMRHAFIVKESYRVASADPAVSSAGRRGAAHTDCISQVTYLPLLLLHCYCVKGLVVCWRRVQIVFFLICLDQIVAVAGNQ